MVSVLCIMAAGVLECQILPPHEYRYNDSDGVVGIAQPKAQKTHPEVLIDNARRSRKEKTK